MYKKAMKQSLLVSHNHASPLFAFSPLTNDAKTKLHMVEFEL